MAKTERKRKVSLGVLFWIAIILLILVVFLFNRRNIEQVMESTGLVEVINQRIGIDEGDPAAENSPGELRNNKGEQPAQNPSENPNVEDGSTSEDPTSQETQQQTQQQSENNGLQNNESTHGTEGEVTDDNSEESSSATEPMDSGQSEPAEKTRSYLIHLTKVDAAGNGIVSPLERQVTFTSSPLTQTIKTLLEDQGDGEAYQNLIPPGSRIQRVWIENGIAYLDFNEDFRFNPMGMTGQRLQLEQVVRTATQFSSVDAVQILINGENVDFLGGEGTYIGSPLRVTDF